MDRRTQQYLIAGGILLTGLILGRACAPGGGDGTSLPDLGDGVVLVSLQMQGEKSMVLPEGSLVDDIEGNWVCVRFPDDATDGRRWIDFGRVSSFAVRVDD
jgi:hypothetical protein